MLKVETIKDGDRFTRHGCGTNTTYYEITKAEYERITAVENYRGELNSTYEANMDDSIRWGYGFYGCGVAKVDDKYYYTVCIGSSCD